MLQGGFDGGGYDAKKADIWSIGILLCEMIGGYTPFKRDATHSPTQNKRDDNFFNQ